ncbi:MAG: sensor histidine kinase [Nocardioides sp.]|nr:sensor histidine kinase [Nocardioides sp.]
MGRGDTARARRGWPTVRVATGARLCGFLALLAPALWTRDTTAVLALVAIGAAWLLGGLAELNAALPAWLTTVLEPLTVGVACGLALHASTAVLGALAIGPVTAALRSGAAGASLAIVSELGALLVIAVGSGLPVEDAEGLAIMSWSVVALGLGMIATYLHAVLRREPDPLGPYHDAQNLIRQLIDLSDEFGTGLDPAALGTRLLDVVRDELPAEVLTVYVAPIRDLSPLVTWSLGPGPESDPLEEVATACWWAGSPVVDGQGFAFPLHSGGSIVGVVAGQLSERVDADGIGLDDRIRALGVRLAASVVHLDTALLFEALRDRATVGERRRLAREIHDGLAQDIASLGYLVDALAADPGTPAQAARIAGLRERISAVVTEVRDSVVTLRTGVGESASLGAALGGLARRLTESSGVPVHVTLDERETRLRPEVEAELFRIAQQAMTNAVQHAAAGSIDVHCRVRPPEAVLTVRDDGRGLGPARPDSQGLDIMRERAALIGGRLDVDRRHPHGTSITVRVPAPTTTPVAATREESVTA